MAVADLIRSIRERRPVSLRELAIPREFGVLVLGPHADDFDNIGVTMRLLADAGARLHVAVVRGGSGVEDSYCDPPTVEHKAAIREREQQASCRFFGLADSQLTFLRLELDREEQPLDNERNVAAVRDLLAVHQPDLVCLPHLNDPNAGHRQTYALLRAAADGMDLAAMLNRDPKTQAMRVDVFTPFDAAQAAWKAQLARFHDTQHQRNLRTRGAGLDDRMLGTNRQAARELGLAVEFAETFELETLGAAQ